MNVNHANREFRSLRTQPRLYPPAAAQLGSINPCVSLAFKRRLQLLARQECLGQSSRKEKSSLIKKRGSAPRVTTPPSRRNSLDPVADACRVAESALEVAV